MRAHFQRFAPAAARLRMDHNLSAMDRLRLNGSQPVFAQASRMSSGQRTSSQGKQDITMQPHQPFAPAPGLSTPQKEAGKQKEKKPMSRGLKAMLASRRRDGQRISKNAAAILDQEADAAQNRFQELNPRARSFEPFKPYESLAFTSEASVPLVAEEQSVGRPRHADRYYFDNGRVYQPGFSRLRSGMVGQPFEGTPTNTQMPSNGKKPWLMDSQPPRIVGAPPTATPAYTWQASLSPSQLQEPQRLLIILDINGTLGYRGRGSSSLRARPFLKEFLHYCFEHHAVLIWSSAMPANVRSVSHKILTTFQETQVLGIWGRDTLGLSAAEFKDKVQVYKRLETVWSTQSAQEAYEGNGYWGQHNTVLIDDSALKAVAQPYNHIEVPECEKHPSFDEGKALVLKQVQDYLEEARWWSDVSGFIKHNKFVIESDDLKVAATVSAVEDGVAPPDNVVEKEFSESDDGGVAINVDMKNA